MFDFFSSLETEAPGEVEMVSLVPDFEEEPEVEEVPEVVEDEPEIEEIPPVEEVVEVVKEPEAEKTPAVEHTQNPRENVAMSRNYEINGEKIEIAYINYNKVRITRGEGAPEIKEFASTKEAVDYYVEQMQELEADE